MSHTAFSPEWLHKYTDPFAILGVSVAADERRILKRYHQLAKQLHPDVQNQATADHQQFVDQVLAKLVNPAYQRLKQDKSRSEVLATLRFKVRRLTREQQLHPTNHLSLQLMEVPEAEVDLFYEQALNELSHQQYNSLPNFETKTRHLSELNLVFLRRKMGDPVIREKRTGLMAASTKTASPIPAPGTSAPAPAAPINYADRHFKRAQEYLKTHNASEAIQELKDALKIDPQNSNYHCLIGQAYLLNKLTGMAKVHFKQSLRLNPKNAVAQKYSRQLGIDPAQGLKSAPGTPSTSSEPTKRGFLSSIFSRR